MTHIGEILGDPGLKDVSVFFIENFISFKFNESLFVTLSDFLQYFHHTPYCKHSRIILSGDHVKEVKV